MKKRLLLAATGVLALAACEVEETQVRQKDPVPTTRELSLSWQCAECIAGLGGGQCADEMDACEADQDCWSMFYALDACESFATLWTPEEVNSCALGAIYATTQDSKDIACGLYWCTWGYGNPPEEWLSCLHGSCNAKDNAIISHVASWCDWS